MESEQEHKPDGGGQFGAILAILVAFMAKIKTVISVFVWMFSAFFGFMKSVLVIIAIPFSFMGDCVQAGRASRTVEGAVEGSRAATSGAEGGRAVGAADLGVEVTDDIRTADQAAGAKHRQDPPVGVERSPHATFVDDGDAIGADVEAELRELANGKRESLTPRALQAAIRHPDKVFSLLRQSSAPRKVISNVFKARTVKIIESDSELYNNLITAGRVRVSTGRVQDLEAVMPDLVDSLGLLDHGFSYQLDNNNLIVTYRSSSEGDVAVVTVDLGGLAVGGVLSAAVTVEFVQE
jgi:hypothetical protein